MSNWLRTVGIIGAIAAIGLGVLWVRRNAILEASLEQGLTAVTGVQTQIEGVDWRLFSGEVDLDGITLDNPEGFTTPYLVRVDRLEAEFNLSSLLKSTVDVPRLALAGVDLNVEQNLQRNNLAIVIDNFGSAPSERSQSVDGKGILVIINRLIIRDLDVSFKGSALGLINFDKTLDIQDIDLTDVNSHNAEGKLVSALASAVLNAIFAEIGDDLTGDEQLPLEDLPFKVPTDLLPF